MPWVRVRIFTMLGATRRVALRAVSGYASICAMSKRTGQIPKRGRWTKRICVVLAVYAAATIAGRLWWGRYADNQLRTELDAIRASGEIIEWSDLARTMRRFLEQEL